VSALCLRWTILISCLVAMIIPAGAQQGQSATKGRAAATAAAAAAPSDLAERLNANTAIQMQRIKHLLERADFRTEIGI